MSKMLCVLFFCFLIISATALRVKSKQGNELIVNGGFEQDGANWISDDIEVLPGTIYNNQWGSGKVTELDAGRGNTRINQKFSLKAGQKCVLLLDSAARTGVSLESNGFSIWWNNALVEKITPSDYNLYHKAVNTLISKDGENIIGFQGEGTQDTLGMTIDNVSLKCGEPPAPPQPWEEGREYLINGNFENPNPQFGWIAESFEGINGHNYANYDYADGTGSELDTSGNTIISQKFSVTTAGGYKLEFDTAARLSGGLETSGLKVHFNNKEIFSYVPEDHNKHHHVFQLDGIAGENVISFEGTGQSEGYGIIIDNASLMGHKVVIDQPPTPTPTNNPAITPLPTPIPTISPTDVCS